MVKKIDSTISKILRYQTFLNYQSDNKIYMSLFIPLSKSYVNIKLEVQLSDSNIRKKRLKRYEQYIYPYTNTDQGGMPPLPEEFHQVGGMLYDENEHPLICEDYYLKPIPNSNQAKKIEINNFARIIVTSLRRNKMHEERLPILETQLSTILSFESTLKKMKKDLAFDMLDPLNTEAKIKEYDEFFNKSLQSLNEFKKDLSLDIEVSPTEVSEIIKIF